MTSVLIKKENLNTETERHTRIHRGHHVEMKAEIRVMHLQAKEHQRLPATQEARREAWKRFSLPALRRN